MESAFSICHLLVTYSDKDKAIPGSSSGLRQWQEDRLWNSSAGAESLGKTTRPISSLQKTTCGVHIKPTVGALEHCPHGTLLQGSKEDSRRH